MNDSFQSHNLNAEHQDDEEGELHPHLLLAFDAIVAEINDKHGYSLIFISDLNRIKQHKVNVEQFKDMILTGDSRLYSSMKLPRRVTKAFYEYFTKDIYMQEGKENVDAKQEEEDLHSQSVEGMEDIDDPFIGLLPNVPIVTDEREIAYNEDIAKRSKLKAMVEEYVPTTQPSQIPLFPTRPPCPPLLQITSFQIIQPVLLTYPMSYSNYVANNSYISPVSCQANLNGNGGMYINRIQHDFQMNQFESYREERPSSPSASHDKKVNAKTEPLERYSEWGNIQPIRFKAFEAFEREAQRVSRSLAESPDKKVNAQTEPLERYSELGNIQPLRSNAFAREVQRIRRTALKIKISNLPCNVTKETLLNLFGPYGDVKEVQIGRSQKNAHAFVTYKIKDAAHRAQRALDRFSVRGQQIKVCIVSNK
eukprot:645693_1